jgi:diguanylate cyclase (GGDEF)-like protein
MGLFDKSKLSKLRDKEKVDKKHRILIVDDEQMNVSTLTAALERDYHILTAFDGAEALEQVANASKPIHLIISDQRMPRMTGVEFLEASLEHSPRTKKIILSGFADVDAIIASINKAKIHAFLLKPVDMSQLTLSVKRSLEAYDLEQHNLQLLDDLKAFNRQLEAKVKERTAELNDALAKLELLATTDQLTGAFNRHKFEELAAEELERVGRYDYPLSVVLFDIDHFKKINDTYGHFIGDRVLKELVILLEEHVRQADTIVRWGGEEFLVLAPHTDRQGIEDLSEKLREAVESFSFPEVGRVTISLGATTYRDQESLDRFLSRADEALYDAKTSGRNYAVYRE